MYIYIYKHMFWRFPLVTKVWQDRSEGLRAQSFDLLDDSLDSAEDAGIWENDLNRLGTELSRRLRRLVWSRGTCATVRNKAAMA